MKLYCGIDPHSNNHWLTLHWKFRHGRMSAAFQIVVGAGQPVTARACHYRRKRLRKKSPYEINHDQSGRAGYNEDRAPTE